MHTHMRIPTQSGMPTVMPPAIAAAAATARPRDRLLDTAVELFAARGFQAIGMRDLAGHLGVAVASLYHHIESKHYLLFELIESALSDLLSDTRRRLKGARTPAERLRRFVQAFVAFSLSEKSRLVLIVREFVYLSDDHKRQAERLKIAYSSLLGTIIAEEYAQGNSHVQDIDNDLHLTAQAVIGMLYGQAQWNDLELPEAHLSKTLTRFALCIIASGKTHRESISA